MKASSQDLRLPLVRAIDAGASHSQIAEQFAVWLSPIQRYLKERRESGNVLAKAIPGRRTVKGAAFQDHLLAQLEAHRDLRPEEHCRLFKEAHGLHLSPASITRARQALGWTR